MLLSEIFGVERDTPFMVDGYDATFMVRMVGNFERLFVLRFGEYAKAVNIDYLQDFINRAPAGIIHLPPPLTDEQREQLRALWTLGYRWLAKDKYGSVYAYEAKPYEKSRDTWLCYGDLYLCYTKPTKYLDSLVSWSDPEPFDIAKALGVVRNDA